jgi:hypothetical protein
MSIARLALLPLAAFATSAIAVPPMAAGNPAADRVRAHVEFLASDLLEGRGTGTRGHEIAASYVASRFDSLGLKPAGENGSWYQWVPFRRATLVEGKTTLAMLDGGKPVALDADAITIRPSLTEKQRKLDAGVVFAGYGLDDSRLRLNDYSGLDVRGKIVVVFRGVPDGLPSDIAAHLSGSKDKAAAAHGALGLIEIPVVAPKPARPGASGPASARGSSAVDWVDASGKAGGEPQGLRVRLNLKQPAAERLFAGASKSLADVRKQAQAKGARPRGFALRPVIRIDSESAWNDFKSPEVIALLPGTDPALKDQYVAMMGHLDHLGLKKDAKPGEDNVYNGALDNAAGVATLLEAAREFVDSGKAPRRSILFIAHTGEELGLLGADYFAAHPTVPIASIVGGVDLDMPVPLYQFNDVVAFGGDHSTIAAAIAEAGKAMNISVSPDPMPQESIFTRSDHYRFVERGVPAILLFTGYGNGGKDKFEDFFAKRYHQVSDDLSQPILWDAAARYAEFNYRIARQLADADQRPMWYQGNYFGDLFAPKAPRAAK